MKVSLTSIFNQLGFSAALFDRLSRPLEPTDVPGGYCYVLQQYVDRPLLLGGRKFELRQYVLLCGDGAGFTYSTALLRLASVPYELRSEDRRAHITNKYVQTGWESTSELVGSLDDIEWTSARWPGYERLLEASLLPLLRDLLDVLQPLLERGRRAAPASASPLHFELFACDLVVTAEGVCNRDAAEIQPRSSRDRGTGGTPDGGQHQPCLRRFLGGDAGRPRAPSLRRPRRPRPPRRRRSARPPTPFLHSPTPVNRSSSPQPASRPAPGAFGRSGPRGKARRPPSQAAWLMARAAVKPAAAAAAAAQVQIAQAAQTAKAAQARAEAESGSRQRRWTTSRRTRRTCSSRRATESGTSGSRNRARCGAARRAARGRVPAAAACRLPPRQMAGFKTLLSLSVHVQL